MTSPSITIYLPSVKSVAISTVTPDGNRLDDETIYYAFAHYTARLLVNRGQNQCAKAASMIVGATLAKPDNALINPLICVVSPNRATRLKVIIGFNTDRGNLQIRFRGFGFLALGMDQYAVSAILGSVKFFVSQSSNPQELLRRLCEIGGFIANGHLENKLQVANQHIIAAEALSRSAATVSGTIDIDDLTVKGCADRCSELSGEWLDVIQPHIRDLELDNEPDVNRAVQVLAFAAYALHVFDFVVHSRTPTHQRDQLIESFYKRLKQRSYLLCSRTGTTGGHLDAENTDILFSKLVAECTSLEQQSTTPADFCTSFPVYLLQLAGCVEDTDVAPLLAKEFLNLHRKLLENSDRLFECS